MIRCDVRFKWGNKENNFVTKLAAVPHKGEVILNRAAKLACVVVDVAYQCDIDEVIITVKEGYYFDDY